LTVSPQNRSAALQSLSYGSCATTSVKDPPNLIRSGSFSVDRLLSHIDLGTAEESDELVSRIHGQRYMDLSSDRNGKTGR
jgi:hypothetical protein